MSDQTKTTGATELLRTQHEKVKTMFAELFEATDDHRRQLFDCLRATLAAHETAEEMVVYPKARSEGGGDIVDRRVKEEDEAKQALAELEKLDTNGAPFDAKIHAFHEDVLRHATAEETELFPVLEQKCSAEELAKMADRILTAEKMAPTHAHPHGPNSAVGNMLVGPFAAMVDKVRDALRS
ncbi:MAG TPA: hemerythrin domain-containing protein [Acidimicrobiia bacterium]|nr:hemerythrin domain-containing protein [Acidimicrobiia bacterium]